MNAIVAPDSVKQLDLMQRLAAYGDGSANWTSPKQPEAISESCRQLHTDLCRLVKRARESRLSLWAALFCPDTPLRMCPITRPMLFS